MARLRWIGVAIISFLLILGGGWFRRAIAFSLCGLLSFNQGICPGNYRVLATETPTKTLQVNNKDTNFIAQTQETNIPSPQNRVVIIVFTGFASQTLSEITGMRKLVDAFRQEAKLDRLDLKIPIFAWNEKKDAINYLSSLRLNNNDKLIVIGHSYGGDTAILLANELKKRNRRVDLLVQVDSVGSSDDVLPSNVAKGINYYQANDDPISLGRFKVQQQVINSTNLDVNRVFRNELIRNKSYPLNHGSIDDSNVVHQAIIQQVLNAVAVKNTTPQASCQATVNKVLQEIRSKGVRRVEFSVYKGTANSYRTGNPTNRTDVLDIILIDDVGATTNNGIAISNIFASPKVLNNWANQIVKSCGNTAIVSFGISQSDIGISYYIQQDGTTKKEKCFLEPNWDISQAQPWGISAIPGCVPD
ncbi:Mbeg1-like protein [Crocosphaera sp. XPORK-15E]|uniref:Mbeg1-like protein n=1 Tax=Crocosphaera sp. XPORK-15E TaxID=3110247 RepID=UPI002B20E429|nr:Mbeg1-like protein [Crocosphaera sp. XPORK-15E]MEA5534133.1 Mbeg1-like protein [Crocosphaera sp. XPORK-15E]